MRTNNPMKTRMTSARYDALMGALTRANDEWEAELSYINNNGEGAPMEYAGDERELETRIALLAEARTLLVRRYGK